MANKGCALFDSNNYLSVAGMSLTESYAMFPGASVSGFYFGHPDSKYFTVGKIGEDQLQDMVKRRKISEDLMKSWLAPNLN